MDALDEDIVRLLYRRLRLSQDIQTLKQQMQLSFYHPLREQAVLEKVPDVLQTVYRYILSESRAVKGKLRIFASTDRVQDFCLHHLGHQYELYIQPPERLLSVFNEQGSTRGLSFVCTSDKQQWFAALEAGLYPIVLSEPHLLFALHPQKRVATEHTCMAWWHASQSMFHTQEVLFQKVCGSKYFTLTRSGTSIHPSSKDSVFRGWLYFVPTD